MAPEPPQAPAQRAKLQGEIAKAQRYAGHSREASTAFSEACTAFLRIMSRIGANAFEHFRRAALRSAPSSSRCQRDMSLRIRSHCISARRTPGAAAMAFAACRCDARNSRPARFARLRPRLGRSILLRRRNLAQCPCRAASCCRFSDIADSYVRCKHHRHGSTTVSLKTVPTPLLPPLTVVP
jgi:hypothetical protein